MRLNPDVPLQKVIRLCSHGRRHPGAHFTRAQSDEAIRVFDASLRTGSASGEPALGFAAASPAPGRRAGSGAFPDGAGMKASLQPPAKGRGAPRTPRAGAALPCQLLGTSFKGSGVGG